MANSSESTGLDQEAGQPRPYLGLLSSISRKLRQRNPPATPPLGLRPLTPTPIQEQHGLYASELIALLENPARRKDIWNIALSGGYGSGKSSVLSAVRSKLDKRVVQISLSSLTDIGLEAGSEADEIDNRIQKEIVKQLLYRESPARVPGSRFRRVSRLPAWRATQLSIILGALTAGILWITGWGDPFQLPPEMERERIGLILVTGFGIGLLTFLIQGLVHNRVRIEKIGTASTSISLQNEETQGGESYFDKYLDEVVYFFEMTKRDIVIIEDLDRFENPAIYASLRALNTVLNSSRQLKRRPVHFIYAVRDSIFEDLLKTVKTTDSGAASASQEFGLAESATEQSPVWQANQKLANPAAQRTKFFDLVIPIVPFITHRTSRDLLVRSMKDIDATVNSELLVLIARHITDMRLLHNIVNEYRVFRARVLDPEKIRGLTSSGLFAMIAFKNTRLRDFELLRVGNSSLDGLYRESRKIIDAGLGDLVDELTALEARPAPVAEVRSRAEHLGAELQALVERWLPRLGRTSRVIQYRVNGVPRNEEISSPGFWSDVIDSKSEIEVVDSSGVVVFSMDAAALKAELGELIPDSWAGHDQSGWNREVQRLRSEQQWLRAADFYDLLEPMRLLQWQGKPLDFRKNYLEPLNDPLLRDLIAAGFIDRNFHLYVSEFHGEVISDNAMSFVTLHILTESPSFRYSLTQSDEIDEVAAVIKEGGPEIFGSAGLFNVAIYDELLRRDDERLDRNLRLLGESQGIVTKFADVYLSEGRHGEALLRRLANFWPGIFVYIGEIPDDGSGRRASYAMAAFEGGNTELEYQINDETRAIIAGSYKILQELTESDSNPRRAIEMLQLLGIRLPSLDGLSSRAAKSVIDARLYTMTGANLLVAIKNAGNEAEEFGLDVLLQVGPAVFDHALTLFDDYLLALDIWAPPCPSLRDPASLLEVLMAIELAHPGRSHEVLDRLPDGLLLESVADVPADILGDVALRGRFLPTASNVSAYLRIRSFDEPLVSFLETVGRLAVEDASDAERKSLATRIVNESQLTPQARVRLVRSMSADVFQVGGITSRDPELIGGLVEADLLAQTPGTFAALADSSDAQVALLMHSASLQESIDELKLTSAVVERLLNSNSFAEPIKREVATLIARGLVSTTPEIVKALARWASQTGTTLRPELAPLAIASKASVSDKAQVLVSAAAELSPGDLAGYLTQLGEPYANLAEMRTKPVDLPARPDLRELLLKMRTSGAMPVSSWDLVGDTLRVWMKRPPRDGKGQS